MKNKTVTVTGGAGLIGSHVTEELIRRGAKVVVIDDFSKGLRENLSAVQNDIDLREGDLEDPQFTAKALSDADIVFHLASRAYGVGYGHGRHMEILHHNEKITNNLFEALIEHKPEHMLVTSSSCVYRDDGPDTIPELPLFDGEPEKVNLGYGWAKRFLEQKANLFSQETGIPISIVRPFNIYGERYRWVGEFSQAIPMLVKKVMDGNNPVSIWGSGNQRRNYIHALDCARIMCDLVEVGFSESPVNIGTEKTIPVADLVRMICAAGDVTPELVFDTTKPEGRFIKSADSSTLRRALPDFEFSTDLESGIEKMIGWWRRNFEAESQQ